MKSEEKKEAINLRNQGWSYNEILNKLKVSKGTLSRWLGNLTLDDEIKAKLSQKIRLSSVLIGRRNQVRWNKLKEEVKNSYIPPLSDPDFMLGLGLYWGEGSKTNEISLANSDKTILKLFISWINVFFKDDYVDIVLRIQHYTLERDDEIKNWWSKELGIVKFHESSFMESKASKKKKNILEFGTATVRIRGKNCWKIREKINKSFATLSLTCKSNKTPEKA